MGMRTYNQIPYMEALGNQKLTPINKLNQEIQANRPVNAPYCMSPRFGYFSQLQMNMIRYDREVKNSITKRAVNAS